MLARLTAAAGVVLIAGVVVRGVLLITGRLPATGPGDSAAFALGVLLLVGGSCYALGWHGRAAFDDAMRRARLMSTPPPARAAPAASVPPAAGRQDASLVGRHARGEVTQPVPRVAPPPVSCRQWAPADLANGRPVCMIRHCGHTPIGYFRASPEGWLCPCTHRRDRPSWAR